MKKNRIAKDKAKTIQKNRKIRSFGTWTILLGIFIVALVLISSVDKKKGSNTSIKNSKKTDIVLMNSCQYLRGGHPISALKPFMQNYKYKMTKLMPDRPEVEIVFSDSSGFCRIYIDNEMILGGGFKESSSPIRISQY